MKDKHGWPPAWSGQVSVSLSSTPTQCCEGLSQRKSTRSDYSGCIPQENDVETWATGAAAIESVLKAADDWVTAQGAIVTAKEAGGDAEVEREAADCAGVQLVMAVLTWRRTR